CALVTPGSGRKGRARDPPGPSARPRLSRGAGQKGRKGRCAVVNAGADPIIIFDTTLRDGEQTPGINLNREEKLEIARQLARLNVDVIEAGFPVASPGDFAAVQAIAREVRGPIIAALARTHPEDIRRAGEAVQDAERPRIHTFIA